MFMCMGHLDDIAYLINDRLVFYRERGAKAYGALPYWISMVAPQVPVQMINCIMFCAMMYPMAGLRSGSDHWGYFFFFMLMSS